MKDGRGAARGRASTATRSPPRSIRSSCWTGLARCPRRRRDCCSRRPTSRSYSAPAERRRRLHLPDHACSPAGLSRPPMYVRHLAVSDFRSWKSADVEFDRGPSVLVGSNGQGKTNLVEAFGLPRDTRQPPRPERRAADPSWRRASAVVQAAVVADDRELRVEVEITPAGPTARSSTAAQCRARARSSGRSVCAVRAGGSCDRARRAERASAFSR